MARKFPRLKSDDFPYVENVDPFKRKNEFDYGRYDYTASAKLMRVTWPSDYRHVVEWESAEARDAWFEAQQGNVIELTQGFVRSQTDRITLDVPYDVALTYNYIYMRVPQLTKDRPIDNEQADGIRTICAFIDSCTYMATSVTEFVISVDVWTTYLPYKSVRGCMLERGHAPMWAMSASEYLERPIERCANLLAPDVSFGSAAVVRGGEFAPLSTAEPVYVMASTIPYGDIDAIATTTNQQSTPPSFYDLDGRDGYQVGVSGYAWGSGKSYANMDSPSTPTRADGSIPTGLYYYGIMGSSVSAGALDTLFTALPVLVTSCKAVFVVPSDLVNIGSAHTIAGVALREVSNKGLQEVKSFPVTKELFAYPARYADIAKLYTDPYAHIEVSDDLGNSVSVAIEDTAGTVDVVQMLSLAFPALEWRAAITNVSNTAGNVRYTWTQLDGTGKSKAITNADFANTFIDYGIPTYQLYLEARSAQALTSWADAQQRRDSALLAYQSTMRSANTGRENAVDNDGTTKANAYRSADASVTNTANSGTTATANTVLDNGLRSTLTQVQNAGSSALESSNVQATENSINSDIVYSQAAADTQLVGEAITGVTNMVGAALSGDVFGVVSSGVGSLVSMGTTATMTNLAALNSQTKKSVNVGLIQDTSGAGRDVARSSTTSRNTHDTSITSNNVSLANTNAANSASTSKSNADASQATGDANATYSRNATMANAKAALSNAQSAYARELDAAAIKPPTEHGTYSGTSVHEIWENKGIHLRAVTQAQGAIKRAGDTFLRFGYQIGAAWEVTSWVPNGARYCYWQATDLWQRLDEVANMQVERLFESILAAGTTVWKLPEEVGRF